MLKIWKSVKHSLCIEGVYNLVVGAMGGKRGKQIKMPQVTEATVLVKCCCYSHLKEVKDITIRDCVPFPEERPRVHIVSGASASFSLIGGRITST